MKGNITFSIILIISGLTLFCVSNKFESKHKISLQYDGTYQIVSQQYPNSPRVIEVKEGKFPFGNALYYVIPIDNTLMGDSLTTIRCILQHNICWCFTETNQGVFLSNDISKESWKKIPKKIKEKLII